MRLDRDAVERLLPHRPPALLLGAAEIVEPGVAGCGTVELRGRRDLFDGHFPGSPIMPGVLLIECIAQTAAVVFACNAEQGDRSAGTAPAPGKGRTAGAKYLLKVDRAVFRRPVLPDQTLLAHVTLIKRFGPMAKVRGTVHVDGVLVAEAMLVLQDGGASDEPPDSAKPEGFREDG